MKNKGYFTPKNAWKILNNPFVLNNAGASFRKSEMPLDGKQGILEITKAHNESRHKSHGIIQQPPDKLQILNGKRVTKIQSNPTLPPSLTLVATYLVLQIEAL